MKIFLTSLIPENKTNRQRQKLDALEYLLTKHGTCQRRPLLRKLAESVFLPDSYLLTLPGPILEQLLVRFYEFIEQKPADLLVHQQSIAVENVRLLLITCPDMPYVVDSLLALRQRLNFSYRLAAHPVLAINRQAQQLTYIGNDASLGSKTLFIIIRLEALSHKNIAQLKTEIEKILTAAIQLNHDYTSLAAQFCSLKQRPGLEAWQDCIGWLGATAFIPFNYRRYHISGDDRTSWVVEEDSNLGVDIDAYLTDMPPDIRDRFTFELNTLVERETAVVIRPLALISPLLRNTKLIYIGFREQNGSQASIEHGFLGLFREIELNGIASNVPALCAKITGLLHKAKISEDSHEYARLQELFDLFPKVELFFLGQTQLQLLLHSLLLYLNRTYTLKLLILASSSPDRISALIILPQPLYKSGIDQALQHRLCKELYCTVECTRTINVGGRFIGLQLTLNPSRQKNYIDVNNVERSLNKLARPWELKLRLLMERYLGREPGYRLWRKYRQLFSSEYQILMPPRYAIRDALQIERQLSQPGERIDLLTPCHQVRHYRLHFCSERQRFLDEYIPVLESLRFRLIDQMQFSLVIEGKTFFIKSFSVAAPVPSGQPLSLLKRPVLDAVQAMLDNRLDKDILNTLIVSAGMTWQEIDVLRAYRNYYWQLGYQSTLASFHHALITNPKAAKSLYRYFDARFRPDPEWEDPLVREERALFPARVALQQDLETVHDINDDRILRALFNLIDATVRTNFHLRKDSDDYFISFKINSIGVIDMPSPRPLYEIYVHAADMEGIHLRGGKIARGGIRWSDRPDDFRTEILGLMQTQMSKNALIIPEGAKGGFVVKHVARAANPQQAGKAAYIKLMRGLLDLTDNYVEEHIVPPRDTVTYDGNDPYLVVAADKGTASFPDIANQVAGEYRFWLHDAFASGGSAGYNHKALGITARGAWECVKRHFRELGKDIQTETFTVVGVGSMDGDVFGNGMLQSRCTRLLAAFDGRHIFIDPNPDPEISYLERQRLFYLPGSGWNDYDSAIISEGGGVYDRDAKDIIITPSLKKWLGIRYHSLDGESLIKYLLAAPVDLLWLGGIGTYVKASTETHDQAGDRANDRVRLDATQIRAKVVGEGANLGFTQKARIEYNLQGGRINTDAIDNSAGVDISDHEVNLKILLFELQKSKRLDNYRQVFVDLTNDICGAVLANNYNQSLCLSLDQLRCSASADNFIDLAERLESAGLLDLTVESFPRRKELFARPNRQLTRPELAVLLAACKNYLKQTLIEQDAFIQAEFCDFYLRAYFPQSIVNRYPDSLLLHPLASNIKAAWISNHLINQAGCTFLNPDLAIHNDTIIPLVSSYLIFDRVLQNHALRQTVFTLDNQVPTDVQYRLLLQLENTLLDFCRWTVLSEQALQPDSATIALYQRYLKEYEAVIGKNNDAQAHQQQLDSYRRQGIPIELARRMVLLTQLQDFPQLVCLAQKTGENFNRILSLFDETTAYLGLNHVYRNLVNITTHNQWERSVYNTLQQNMKNIVGHLVVRVCDSNDQTVAEYFAGEANQRKIKPYQQVYQHICNELPSSLIPYIALMNSLQRLA